MGAQKGNQFWKARTKHGRDKIFSSKEALWDACCEYFQWVEDNPLIEIKVGWFQGVATQEEVSKMRAMTMDGMCIFLNIGTSTWADWRKKENDFSEVIANAEMVMRNQKFTGAAADLLNPNIIARDLHLTDKQEINHESKDGSMSPKSVDSDVVNALVSKLTD